MKTRRRNYNADEISDKLSDLPDFVLIHILSILNTKQSVQTCILSKRWRNLWKYIPVISLNSFYFKNIKKDFTKFVYRFLSLRDDKSTLHALKFLREGHVEHRLLKRVIKYAFSHNVKLLDIHMACNLNPFPLSYFSSLTLTSLNLISERQIGSPFTVFPNSLNFPLLTHLSIKNFGFHSSGDGEDCYVDPFSTFKSLNTFYSTIELTTPNLCSFDFIGNPSQKLTGGNIRLSSIKHVNIKVSSMDGWSKFERYPLVLLDWLVELALTESLTVNSTTLKVLCLTPNLWKVDFPYLCNLKSLKIDIVQCSSIPKEAIDFLLQNAPSAKKVIIKSPKKSFNDYRRGRFGRGFYYVGDSLVH
ncbi:putative F-box/FBD/LRR-repeat protein At1g78760 [Vicia villosa]|uniref:putative F-box/FBD/LRR-repeat protein At1g78760 n=1 Tax=Vicia villosa TaxID=3911 RepID=UPI00273C71BC|nr:putative F-box/FBD/LRR-repeat protein At1g78760 [Vicia villosa]